MSVQKCTLDKKAKTLTIVMSLDEPKASQSGKTVVIASTHGNAAAGCEYDGKPITIGVNAYYKP